MTAPAAVSFACSSCREASPKSIKWTRSCLSSIIFCGLTDDPLPMCIRQRLRQLPRQPRGTIELHSRFGYGIGEGLAVNECTGDVVGVAVPAGIEDGDDVGVAQVGRGLRLAQEPLGLSRVGCYAGVGNFECDLAVQLGVIREVDGAEGACSKPATYRKPTDRPGPGCAASW